jgi:hypothetical protein
LCNGSGLMTSYLRIKLVRKMPVAIVNIFNLGFTLGITDKTNKKY